MDQSAPEAAAEAPDPPVLVPRPDAAPRRQTLTEKYRPRSIADIVGQPDATAALAAWLADPMPQAFIFAGSSGVGKTSAAWALAADLGCNIDSKPVEFGGVYTIPSGEQDAAIVKEMWGRMYTLPFDSARGWKVLLLNEVEQLSGKVEALWLDRLENVPDKTAVIFTTNAVEALPERFRDRCEVIGFDASAGRLESAARALADSIWTAETGQAAPADVLDKVVSRATAEGRISFRRVVQALVPLIAAKGW